MIDGDSIRMKTKFAVIADLHVDIMNDAEERLKAFLAAARAEGDVDFVIQLGDFCYPDENRRSVCAPEKLPPNIEAALKNPTYADKERIHSLYRDFEKPSFHVIGNHDCDLCTKRQVLDYYGAAYEPYYSFDCGGFHFIVLAPNYYKKDGKYISYECGNYFDIVSHVARASISSDRATGMA